MTNRTDLDTTNHGSAIERAASAIRDGEARNLGRTAMARRYKALFAAEDAAKFASHGWS